MSKEKIAGVEFIRLCATIGVIMNHVGVCWISAYGDTANANEVVLFKTINGLAFWPVPLFMMITGFLRSFRDNLLIITKYFVISNELLYSWLYSEHYLHLWNCSLKPNH